MFYKFALCFFINYKTKVKMTYQNRPKLAESKRIRSVLQHQAWLEKEQTEPLDLTHLSNAPPLSTTSWLSTLNESERQKLYDRLSELELIFWSVGDNVLDKVVTDKNRQIINENYERVVESRLVAKQTSPHFEKVAA